MTRELLAQLHRARPLIRRRWEELLRVEPVSSPLANPDAMAMFIPDSLADIDRALRGPFSKRVAERGERHRATTIDCGHNPYRAYFNAGEQALKEAVVLAQTACHADTSDPSAVGEVGGIVQAVARPQINAFCRICRNYRLVEGCRFVGRRPAAAVAR